MTPKKLWKHAHRHTRKANADEIPQIFPEFKIGKRRVVIEWEDALGRAEVHPHYLDTPFPSRCRIDHMECLNVASRFRLDKSDITRARRKRLHAQKEGFKLP